MMTSRLVWIRSFQSTLPRGERLQFYNQEGFTMNFNPRSHEGSDEPVTINIVRAENFNPRSHEGSDCESSYGKRDIQISIHAPTRGATTVTAMWTDAAKFQSTLPRGERPGLCFAQKLWQKFQSTLPRGERRGSNFHIDASSLISIHAPTRGATKFCCS